MLRSRSHETNASVIGFDLEFIPPARCVHPVDQPRGWVERESSLNDPRPAASLHDEPSRHSLSQHETNTDGDVVQNAAAQHDKDNPDEPEHDSTKAEKHAVGVRLREWLSSATPALEWKGQQRCRTDDND